MPREIFLDQLTDTWEAVQMAVERLEAGETVCLPDESGWMVVGLAIQEQTSLRLAQLSHGSPSTSAVIVPHPAVVNDYVTDTSRLFSKLASRCWPGPVILRGGAGQSEGLARQWPTASQEWAQTPAGKAFYCPSDAFTKQVLSAVSSPALGVVGQGAPDPARFDAPHLELIFRSSRTRFSDLPTVVSAQGEMVEVESPGAVSDLLLSRLAGDVFLFICTGNTCRSPMAEAIFRHLLAERIDCHEDELIDRGYIVLSAGLSAIKGAPASPEAVKLLRKEGVDLSEHNSQPASEELLFRSDRILTMTRGHRDAVLSAYPELGDKVRLLSPENKDVPDPIGAGMDEYIRCKDTITRHLQHLLERVVRPEKR